MGKILTFSVTLETERSDVELGENYAWLVQEDILGALDSIYMDPIGILKRRKLSIRCLTFPGVHPSSAEEE